MIRAATALILLLCTAEFGAETIDVRNRGSVELTTFECRDINRSTIIRRVCYDKAQGDLIVGLDGGYVQYCRLPAPVYDALMGAPSMGQFFNRNIAAAAANGRYDCGTHRRPNYPAATRAGLFG